MSANLLLCTFRIQLNSLLIETRLTFWEVLSSTNDETEQTRKVYKPITVVTMITRTLFPYDMPALGLVRGHFGIQINHHDGNVTLMKSSLNYVFHCCNMSTASFGHPRIAVRIDFDQSRRLSYPNTKRRKSRSCKTSSNSI